jgi:hypothetical protein
MIHFIFFKSKPPPLRIICDQSTVELEEGTVTDYADMAGNRQFDHGGTVPGTCLM